MAQHSKAREGELGELSCLPASQPFILFLNTASVTSFLGQRHFIHMQVAVYLPLLPNGTIPYILFCILIPLPQNIFEIISYWYTVLIFFFLIKIYSTDGRKIHLISFLLKDTLAVSHLLP